MRHLLTHRWSRLFGYRPPSPDDVTLAQRVRSEIFAPRDIPDGGVNVDAHAGVVTLRGQLPTSELIERLVHQAEGIDGVVKVRSLLHTPQEPTPVP